MHVLIAISIVAFAGLLWASLAAAQHIRRTRRERRRDADDSLRSADDSSLHVVPSFTPEELAGRARPLKPNQKPLSSAAAPPSKAIPTPVRAVAPQAPVSPKPPIPPSAAPLNGPAAVPGDASLKPSAHTAIPAKAPEVGPAKTPFAASDSGVAAPARDPLPGTRSEAAAPQPATPDKPARANPIRTMIFTPPPPIIGNPSPSAEQKPLRTEAAGALRNETVKPTQTGPGKPVEAEPAKSLLAEPAKPPQGEPARPWLPATSPKPFHRELSDAAQSPITRDQPAQTRNDGPAHPGHQNAAASIPRSAATPIAAEMPSPAAPPSQPPPSSSPRTLMSAWAVMQKLEAEAAAESDATNADGALASNPHQERPHPDLNPEPLHGDSQASLASGHGLEPPPGPSAAPELTDWAYPVARTVDPSDSAPDQSSTATSKQANEPIP